MFTSVCRIQRNKKDETAFLKYLLESNSDDLFDKCVEYFLREEVRGYEFPIECRKRRSINRAFEVSSWSPKQVDETKWKLWGETIFKRAKSVGMEKRYLAFLSLSSHAVHGNWQDLLTYHLKYENGEFSPKTE